jgi:hypothetical protein
MKTHAIRSTKLLTITAVTILAAGCAATPAATSPSPQAANGAPTTLPATVDVPTPPSPTSPAMVEPAAHVEPRVPQEAPVQRQHLDDEHAGKALVSLREELFRLDDETSAFARVAYFRPLCDADGYPVVGNVMRKASGYQASTFCSELRARASKK